MNLKRFVFVLCLMTAPLLHGSDHFLIRLASGLYGWLEKVSIQHGNDELLLFNDSVRPLSTASTAITSVLKRSRDAVPTLAPHARTVQNIISDLARNPQVKNFIPNPSIIGSVITLYGLGAPTEALTLMLIDGIGNSFSSTLNKIASDKDGIRPFMQDVGSTTNRALALAEKICIKDANDPSKNISSSSCSSSSSSSCSSSSSSSISSSSSSSADRPSNSMREARKISDNATKIVDSVERMLTGKDNIPENIAKVTKATTDLFNTTVKNGCTQLNNVGETQQRQLRNTLSCFQKQFNNMLTNQQEQLKTTAESIATRAIQGTISHAGLTTVQTIFCGSSIIVGSVLLYNVMNKILNKKEEEEITKREVALAALGGTMILMPLAVSFITMKNSPHGVVLNNGHIGNQISRQHNRRIKLDATYSSSRKNIETPSCSPLLLPNQMLPTSPPSSISPIFIANFNKSKLWEKGEATPIQLPPRVPRARSSSLS